VVLKLVLFDTLVGHGSSVGLNTGISSLQNQMGHSRTIHDGVGSGSRLVRSLTSFSSSFQTEQWFLYSTGYTCIDVACCTVYIRALEARISPFWQRV